MLKVSMKLWRVKAVEQNGIGLCLISISLQRRRWGKMKRMSKMAGNKMSIDKNSSFACFTLCGQTISVGGQTMDSINWCSKKRSPSGSLVILWQDSKIISGESPDMMTGQIHFSLVTYCFSIFMTLSFFHLNYPFVCVTLETLFFITTVWKFCKPWLKRFLCWHIA